MNVPTFAAEFSPNRAAGIESRAMLASLKISTWSARAVDKGATKKVNSEAGAADDAGRFNKRLVSKHALAKLQEIAGQARAYHAEKTLPWAADGVRILAAILAGDYSAEMQKQREAFEGAVLAFLQGYPDFVSNARADLGALFRADDYPDLETVRRKFAFETGVFPLPVTADFRVDMAESQAADMRAAVEKTYRDTMANAVRDVWSRIGDVVSAMSGKLRDYKPAQGEEKAQGIFRDSLVGNIRDLVAILPALNITGDPRLEKATADLEKLARFDAKELRDSDSIRSATADAADAILDEMRQFVA